LLHDMGKLAIPEHILNKPGKLTESEFEKMKRHADIGADLLSAIKFPYPVVPIVRHHHERWDGKGYPTGISGPDIPLGARILSVVDCFDALTSDRPYRPRLPVEDAFSIIQEGRGTLYDPLVVDTFIDGYMEIAPTAVRAGQEAKSILSASGFADLSKPQASLDHIMVTAVETSLLEELRRRIARTQAPDAALSIAGQYLQQLTAATVCAYYRYDRDLDAVICEKAVGDKLGLLEGLSIPVGSRISGWCAATERVTVNADASLDLAQIATRYSPPLRCALCIPVTVEERVIGVFTAYATKEGAFKESDRYLFEQVVLELRDHLRGSLVATPRVVAFPYQKR